GDAMRHVTRAESRDHNRQFLGDVPEHGAGLAPPCMVDAHHDLLPEGAFLFAPCEIRVEATSEATIDRSQLVPDVAVEATMALLSKPAQDLLFLGCLVRP